MKCKPIRCLLAAALLVSVLFTFTSCGQEKKLTEAYRSGVAAAKTSITAENREFTETVSAFFEGSSDESKKAVLTAIDELAAAYRALEALTPPEAYAETQASLGEAASLAKQAAAVYREQFESLDLEAQSVADSFVEELLRADELLREANGKLNDAADTVA